MFPFIRAERENESGDERRERDMKGGIERTNSVKGDDLIESFAKPLGWDDR